MPVYPGASVPYTTQRRFGQATPKPDPSKPRSWEAAAKVLLTTEPRDRVDSGWCTAQASSGAGSAGRWTVPVGFRARARCGGADPQPFGGRSRRLTAGVSRLTNWTPGRNPPFSGTAARLRHAQGAPRGWRRCSHCATPGAAFGTVHEPAQGAPSTRAILEGQLTTCNRPAGGPWQSFDECCGRSHARATFG